MVTRQIGVAHHAMSSLSGLFGIDIYEVGSRCYLYSLPQCLTLRNKCVSLSMVPNAFTGMSLCQTSVYVMKLDQGLLHT